MLPKLRLTLLLILFTTTCYANQNSCSKTESNLIATEIKHYVDSKTAIASRDVTILNKKCVGSYASATVHPIKPVTDDATIYLHKVKNQWQVMSMGTAFDEEFLKQLPKALR